MPKGEGLYPAPTNKRINELDARISAMQKGTRALVPAVVPLHDILRQKFRWYKRWSSWPAAKFVNMIVLFIYIAGASYFGINGLINSHKVLAAHTACTWTNGGANNIWNNAANWSCGNVPNNTNDVIFNGATSNANITIDVAANVGSFTTTGAVAGGGGASGQAAVMNTGAQLNFTSNAANVTVNSTTGVFSGYAWLDDAGWVAFGTADNAVDGPVTENTSTGAVTGKAKILNDGTLIDFNASPYNSNVVINTTTGAFSGYAWSDSLGWIDFTNVKLTSAYTGTITANFGLTTDTSSGGSGDFTLGGGTYVANATNISVAGNYTRAGGTFTAGTSTITMTSTSTGKTFTAGGQTYNNITFNGAGGGWSMVDNLTTSSTGTVTLTQGTLHTDGAADNLGLSHNWWKFATAAGTKTLNLGNSTITLTGTGTPWNYSTTSATLNAGTSIIILSGNSITWSGGAETYYDVRSTGSGVLTLAGGPTFTNLTRTGTSSQLDGLNITGVTTTVNGVLTLTGNSAINRLSVQTNLIGVAKTFALGGSATMASVAATNYVDFMDITVTGGAANERDFQTNAKSAGDCGGNTGITFTTAAPQTWNGATGTWSTAGLWTSRIPLPQDNVTIGAATVNGNTLTADMPRLGKDILVNNTDGAKKPTVALNNQANTIYGSLTYVSSTYLSLSQNKDITFAGRANASVITAGQTLGTRGVYIAKPGSTLTTEDAVYSTALWSVLYGTLTTNYSVTMGRYNANPSTTTNINSDWILNSGANGIWTNNASTINMGAYSITITYAGATAQSFIGGTSTYNNIVITPGSGVTTFSGAFTFANMTMASAGTKTVKFTKNTTYTMTGNNFLSGSGTGNITINSDDGATAFTLNKTGTGIISSDYLTLDRSTATQTNTFYAGAHSTDGTHNTNWLFTVPPVPTAPTIGTAVPQSATSMRWVFTDNANSEDGFKVYDGADVLKATCVGVNFTYCDETGLSVNTLYNDRYVVAYNATGNSAHSATAAGKYTLVNTPTAPTVNATSSSSLTVIIAQNGNPDPATTYEINETTTGKFVQADGTLNTTEVYQTYTNWGGAGGKINTGLTAATQYTYQIKAKNGDSVTGSFSPTASQTTLTAGDTLSGSLYSDLGVTKITSAAKTINVSINGGAVGTKTAETSAGDFTVNLGTTLAPNDIITVFVSAETEKASTVTKVSATGNLTGINLYQNYTIIRHEGSISQIINGDLNTAGGLADADELFSTSSNNTTFTQGIYVWSAKSYIPGGNVTTTNANIAGTLDMASSGYILELTGSGTPFVVDGTFTTGTNSTVKYTAASNTNITATTYNNLTTAPSATMSNYTVSGAGNAAYNGIYTAAGTWNGDPYYTNGSYALYRATNMLGQEMWRLWTDALKQTDNAPAPNAAYFGQISADLPANAWVAGIGAGPAPLVTSGYTFASGTVTITGNYTNGDGVNAVNTTADINDPTITISGNFVNSSGSTFVASSSGAFNIAGNYTNSGTFTNSGGGMTLNGGAAQSFTAGGTGAGYNLYNLTAANTSGNTLGITFTDSLTLDTGGRFTDTTQDSKLIFNNNSTYTFPNITITGATGHNILMTKSAGVNKWFFNVSQASPTVTYVTPTNSNATGSSGAILDSTGGVDGGGNTNWNFGSVAPNAPTIAAPTAQSATSIRWNFTDNASNETGFKVYDAADSLLTTCSTADLTYCDETGLGVNTQATGRYVVAYNATGNSAHSATAASIYTLANTPTAPTVNQVPAQPTQLQVIVGVNSNPAGTQFAIQETQTSGNKYVQADGSLNTSAVWQTYAQWGSGTGTTVTGLTAATQYTFQVKAQNGDNTATAFGATAQQTTVANGNTISGSLYSDLGVTKIGAAKTIHASVNGGAAVSTTTSGGDFTLTTASTLNANDIITIFVSGDAGTKASTITKVSATGNLATINLYQNYTIIRHEGTITSILNTDLATADNLADTDILFSVNVSNKATFTQGVYILTGKTYAPGGDVESAGSWNATGTFTYDTYTVNLTGTGNISNGTSFYDLHAAAATKTTTISGITVKNVLTIDTGIISGGSIGLEKANGTPLVTNGADITGTTIAYYGNQAVTATTYGSLILAGTGASPSLTLAGNITVATLSVYNLWANGQVTVNSNDHNIIVSTLLVGFSGGTNKGGILNMNAGALTVSGNVTTYSSDATRENSINFTSGNMSVTGNWTNSDVFTPGSGTVSFIGNAAAHQTITTNGQSFNNLTINNNQATYDQAIISGNLDVNGALTVTDGNLKLDTNNPNVYTAGAVNIGASGAVTKGSGTWSFDGTTTYTDSTATPQNIGVAVVDGTTTLASSMTVDKMTVNNTKTLNLASSGYTLKLANAGAVADVLTVTGTLNPGTNSIVQYTATNSGGNINVPATTYKHLKFTPGSAESYNLTGSLTSGNAMTGDLTIDANATLNTYVGTTSYDLSCASVSIAGTLYAGTNDTVGTSTITASGDWNSLTGTFTRGMSTVTFVGNNTKTVTLKTATRFYNLNFPAPEEGQSVTMNFGTGGIAVNNIFYGGNSRTTINTNSGALYLWSANTNNPFTHDGLISSVGLIIYTTTTTPATVNLSGGNFNNVYLWPDDNGVNFKLAGDWTLTGGLYVYGSAGVTAVLDLNGYDISTSSTIGVGVSGVTNKYATLQNTGASKSTITCTSVFIYASDGAGDNKILADGANTIDFTVSSNWTNSDIFTAGTSTVNFTKATGTQTLNSGGTAAANTFNNLTHSGAGTLQLITNDLKASGNFVNSAGTFDTNARDITVGGNVDLTGGSFTQGTGRINLNGAAAQSFTAGGTGAGHTPYNITTTNASAAGLTLADSLTLATGGTFTDTTQDSKITFNDNSTYTFPNILINGATGHRIILTKSAGIHKWLFNVPGTPTVTYVAVDHSNATGSGATIDATAGGLDNNNNINWNFGAVAPNAPTLPTQNVDSATQITFGWTDNSSNETGFKVYVSTVANADCSLASYPGSPNYTTAADATSQSASSLGVNSQYCAKITATNANGDSTAIYTAPKYTLVNTPTAPTVNATSSSSLTVIINQNGNPDPATTYEIQETTSGNYLQADGTLGAGEVYQTYTNWGGAGGKINTGLSASTSYTYQIKAKNGDSVTGSFSPTASQTTLAAGDTLSGSLYSDLGVTKIGAAKTIHASINGGAASSTTTSGGDFTINLGATLNANDIITVFVSGDAGTKASTVTKVSATGNLTTINLYQNYTIIRHEGSIASILNTDLATADNIADTDILFSVNGSNVASFTQGLYLLSTKTYSPSGDVIVAGNWDSSAGTFTYSTYTVTLTGSAKTIITPVGAQTTRFAYLTIDTGATITATNGFNTSKRLKITGTLTIVSGQSLYTQLGSSIVIDAGGVLTGAGSMYCQSSSTLSNSGTISVSNFNYNVWSAGTVTATTYGGNLTIYNNNSGTITETLGAGSLSVTGTLTVRSNIILDNTVNNSSITAGVLSVGDSGTTATYGTLKPGTGAVLVTGNLNIYASDASGDNKLDCTGVACNISVGGNWTNSDTFTAGTSTVTFNGTVAQTITGATTWYNLTINNTYASPSDTFDVDPGASQTVSNILTVTDGQWTPCTGDSYKDVSIGAAGIMKPDASASITVSGNWDSSAGIFTYGTSTVTMTAAAGNTTLTTPSSGNSYDGKFYNLTINSGANKVSFLTGTSAAPSHALNITGEFEIGTGQTERTADTASLTINASGKLSGAGTYIQSVSNTTTAVVNNGTISVAVFYYYASVGATTAPITATTYGGMLAIINAGSGSTTTVLSSGTLSVLGASLSISGSTGYSITLDNTANNAAISVTGNLLIGTSGSTNKYGTLKPGTGAVSVTGNVTVYASDASGDNKIDSTGVAGNILVGGSWTNNDTFIAGTSTVNFNGAAAGKTINGGASGFYTMTLSGAGGWTLNTSHLTSVTNINVTNGTLNTGTLNLGTATTTTINVDGGTLTGGSGTINAKTFNVTNGLFTAGAGIVTLGASTTIGLYTHTTGTVDWLTNNSTLNWFTYTGEYDLPADTYYNLTLPKSKVNLTSNTTVNNNFTMGTVGTAWFLLHDHTFTVYGTVNIGFLGSLGEFNGSGTSGILKTYGNVGFVGDGFVGSDVTLEFAKTSGIQTMTSNSYAMMNILHSGAGTVQLIDAMDINGNFTNSNGTFDANGQNINIAKNWTISGGAFSAGSTPGTQTVIFDSTNNSTIIGSSTFNNLTMDSSVDGAKQINFTAASTQTISAGKTWTLNGAVGKVLTLRSTVDTSAWKFVIPADFTAGTYVDVKDSQNTTNAFRITPGTNTTDSGNNTPGWNFAPKAPTIGAPAAQSTTSIRWNFTDTADNETGFKVYDSSDVLKATCATADLTYCDETGLSVNTQYTGRYVVAYNAVGNSAHSATAASIYTLANTPLGPTVNNTAATSSLTAIVNQNGNPAATPFEIHETSTNKYVQADGSLGVTAIYQTYAQWNGASGTTVTGLSANTNYTFEVKAKNGDDITTAFSATSSKYTLIETPTGITFGAVNDDSIALSAAGSLSNLTAGTSGLQFSETSGNAGSGGQAGFNPLWTNTNSVTDTGLSLGIQYSYKVKARNGNGVETAETSIFNQTTTSSGLTAPSNVTLTVDMTTQLTAHWTDNSASETGFKVYVSTVANTDCSLATYPASPNYTTAANATSRFLTSLDVNSQYCAKITATTGLVNSSPAYAAAPKYTFANIPLAPTVAAASSTSLNTLITQTGNPAWTQYTIYNSTLNLYVQADGSTSGSAVWQTYAQWGGNAGMNNTGLGVNKRYNYQITAQNGDGVTGNGGDPIEDCTTNLNVANAGDSAYNGDYILAGSFNAHSYYTFDASGTMMALWSGQASPGHYTWRLSPDSTKVTGQSAPASFPYYGSAGADDPLPAAPWNVGTGAAGAPSLLCGQSGTYTASAYTFANTPATPTLSPISTTSLNSIINVNANPSYTQFAIYNATSNKYVQADGTLGASPVWQTNAEWNAGAGMNTTGLAANTIYNYQIRVRNSDNLETVTPQLGSGTAKYTLIETPTNITFDTLTSTSIAIHSFNTPSHLTDGQSGLIFSETSGHAGAAGEACFTLTTANSCTDIGLSVNTRYFYTVKAQNGDGVQTAETEVLARFTLANTPSALGVEADYNETDGYLTTLTLHANGNPDGTEYQINTDAWAAQNNLQTQKKVALTCNQSYNYAISSRNGDLVSSGIAVNSSDTTPLCAPTTLSETDLTATSSVLNWDAVAGTNPLYDISFGKDASATDLGVTSDIADVTLAQGALDPNTTYYYKVRSHNTNGTGAWSAVKNFLTHKTSNQLLITLPGQSYVPGTGLVGTPNHQTAGVPFTANIVAVDTDLQVTPDYNHSITFSAPTDYLASTYGSTSNAGAPAGPATLVAGQKEVTFTLYQAKPQIISASGSSGASADFIVDPGPTSKIKSKATPLTQTLTTAHNGNITVNLQDNFGNMISGHTITATSNQVGDIALSQNATDTNGNATITVSSGLAHTSSITITDSTTGVVLNDQPQIIFSSACSQKPAAPSNLRATTIAATNLSLAWDGSAAACGLKNYEIYNAQTGIKIGTTENLTWDIQGLAPKTSYSFFIIAIDQIGNASDHSDTLTLKTLKGDENAPIGNVCHANGGEVAFLILGNTPEEVTAGQVFPNDVIVKVMVADGGGALCEGYRGGTYFTSTDKKAVLAWTADRVYNFTQTDAGQHQFSGSDFKLYTVGDQTLTVTDKAVSGQAEIKVLSSRIIFQKAQNTITNFLGRNSMRVNTAVVATTTVLLLAPIMVNLIIALSNFIPQIIYWLTQLLQMLGLRKKRKPWGIIFNSQTGQPVSLAVVKIFDREYHRQLESTVTDKAGRFGFLVRPGTFYLTVSKTGFVFPSQFKISEFFENVYAGGNLKIDAKTEKAVTMNVPIDPQARASVVFALWVTLIKLNRFLQKIRLPLMAAGTIFAVIMIISAYHIIYALSLVLYAFLFALEIFQAKKSRPYGVVSDVFGNPLELSIVRIYSKKTNRLIATDVTDAQGRFKFLVNPGIFYLMTAKPGYLDFKSHIMYLEGERTMVTVNIKLKKVEKHLLDKNEKLRSW